MTLLNQNEEITSTLGYLHALNFDFGKDNSPLEVYDGLFLIPFDKNRPDIKHIEETKDGSLEMTGLTSSMKSYGTFVLHSLEKKRPLKNVWESFEKFANLCLAIRLLSRNRCDSVLSLHYDDTTTPIKFYEPSLLIEQRELYVHTDEFSKFSQNDLIEIRKILKSIEENTIPDTIDPKKYSRLNNALRVYRIAYETKWLLMKTILLFIALESLFSDRSDQSDISYKVRLRSAHLLYPNIEDKEKREKIFEHIKHGYDIRSRFLHGDNVEKEILNKQKKHKIGEYTYLYDYVPLINEIVSMIILKILEDDKNLQFFSKEQNSTSEKKFFNDLVL